ncbi:transposase [Comamonas testosteroni]|uniref:transposase n=1 Tax=Comamonas TaxID=283 RepID=UPI0002464AFF|nr:transposase IS3/IS911 family protein [Comamonas testosteroni ATCC 11996]
MTSKQVRAQYTQDFKLEAVRQVQQGQSAAAVGKILGIPKASLANWVRQAALGQLEAAHPQARSSVIGSIARPTTHCEVTPAPCNTAHWRRTVKEGDSSLPETLHRPGAIPAHPG